MSRKRRARRGIAERLWRAGFRDLVSVIPPDGELSEKSNVSPKDRGKCPGLLVNGKWRGYRSTNRRVTERYARRWDTQGANIGLLGNRFPGLDIDVDEDPELADAIQQCAEQRLGPAPVRLSRSSRRLLVYRTDRPFGRIAAIVKRNGQTHLVEFLGKDRQYLVHGRHPAGVDYRWDGRPLWEYVPGDLSEIDVASVHTFFDELKAQLEGSETIVPNLARLDGITVDLIGSDSSDAGAPDQETLLAPSLEHLRNVVEKTPNPADADRAHYVKMTCAIKAAAGQENEDDARELFLEWAGCWDGKVNPNYDEKTWDSLEPPFRVGWTWLQAQAEKGGQYCSAQDDFDVIEGASSPSPDAPESSDAMTRAIALAESLGMVSWNHLSERLRGIHATLPDLPPGERRIVEAVAIGQLRGRQMSDGDARALFRLNAPADERSAFTRDETGRPTLRLLTAEDVSTRACWLVEDRIPSAAVGALVSDFSMGKTWLAIDLGLSVAFGLPWIGAETDQRPVVFVIAEGNHEFPKRVRGLVGRARSSARDHGREPVLRRAQEARRDKQVPDPL